MSENKNGQLNSYTAEDFKVLDSIKHIRLRKNMYIGEGINPYQLFSEALDNSVDEVGGGFGSSIQVYVDTKLNRYTVKDDGRGIPIGLKELEGGAKKEIVEVTLTVANSGGKFDHNAYKMSSGLHGVGSTLINALSTDVELETRREEGKSAKIVMKDGEKVSLDYSDIDGTSHGTTISFIPDSQYFETEIIPFDEIFNKCKILKSFGVSIELYKDGELQEINYSSPFDLIPKEENIYLNNKFEINSEDNEDIIVALQYCSNTKCQQYGYTNYLYNRLGGNQCISVKNWIIEVWKEFNSQVELKDDDYTLGLDCLTAVFIGETKFLGQTKDKLLTSLSYFDKFKEEFKSQFRQLLIDNEKIRDALLKRFEEYRLSQNRYLTQKDIMSKIKINDSKDGSIRRRSVVSKLKDCTNSDRSNTELLLCEGDSAAAPATRSRDTRLQAILPLRGKILNVTYMKPVDALNNSEVCDICNAIGAGLGDNVDPSKSRYDKIIFMTDADEDSYHIRALLASLFINLLPNLVKAGMVYVCNPPLYTYKDNEGIDHYTNDYDEASKFHFERLKGLGSMEDYQFHDSCLVAGHRDLVRLNYPDDLDKFNRILGTSGGRSDLLKETGVLKDLYGDSEKLEESLCEEVKDGK